MGRAAGPAPPRVPGRLVAVRERGRMRRRSREVGTVFETGQGRFCLDPRDRSVSRLLIETGSYGTADLEHLAPFLGAASEVLVVGAHVGALVVPLASRVSRIAAVEADPRTYELLELNLRLNGAGNVSAHNFAAGAANGTLRFLSTPGFSGGSKMLPRVDAAPYLDEGHAVIEVPARRIDDVFPDPRFDLVIMDIEGAEYFALQGMPRVLERCRALAVEFMPHHLRNVAGITVAQFLEPLSDFATMISPRLSRVVYREEFAGLLTEMHDRDVSDDGLIFHKQRLAKVAKQSSGGAGPGPVPTPG